MNLGEPRGHLMAEVADVVADVGNLIGEVVEFQIDSQYKLVERIYVGALLPKLPARLWGSHRGIVGQAKPGQCPTRRIVQSRGVRPIRPLRQVTGGKPFGRPVARLPQERPPDTPEPLI